MKKYIHMKKEDREFISKALGVTPRMIFNAVHFESDSDLARKVRKMAMDRGGIVMVEAPEAETLFDADGYMRQRLVNGVLLEFNMKDSSCEVLMKGETVRRYENVLVSEIPQIQDWASALR
jgi:hypothetical protein